MKTLTKDQQKYSPILLQNFEDFLIEIEVHGKWT